MRKVAFISSLILVFTIPWENAVTVSQFGTLTRLIGGLTAVACIGVAIETGFRRPHLFHAVVFAFLTWNIASYFWSQQPAITIQRIITYSQLIILSWIFWELYTEVKDVRAALQAYILGGYVTITSTFANYFYGQIISKYEFGRYAGASLNAVDQALVLAFGLPIAWDLATSNVPGKINSIFRFINYAYIPISLFAIILTGSRTGIFVCLAAVLYILCTSQSIKKVARIFVYLLFFGIMIFAVYHTPAETIERLTTAIESITTGDLGGRFPLWKASMLTFSNHPLLGIGSGALTAENELNAVAHNTFLSVAAELGLIGISIFIVILMILIFQVFHLSNQSKPLWATIFLIWLLGAATLTWEYRKPTWFFLNMILTSANLYRQRSDWNYTEKIK